MNDMKRNMTIAALMCIMTMAVLTSCTNDNVDNPSVDGEKPTYKYLYYADARDNMSAEERTQYEAYCWRLERKDKYQEPKNWRTCQGEGLGNG